VDQIDHRPERSRAATGRGKRAPVRTVYIRVILFEAAIIVGLWFLGRVYL
jgi:hypothetical protein